MAPSNNSLTPRAPRKEIDVHFAEYLVFGYKNGGFVDVLLQDLVHQGYRRPSYCEVAENFLQNGLELSVDRVLNEEDKPAAAHAIQEARTFKLPINASTLQFTERDEEGNKVNITDPARKQKLFDSMFNRGPEILDEDRKPFDRDAAIYIVENFRGGLFAEWILDELDEFGYMVPSWDVVHKILAANGMKYEDGYAVSRQGCFVAYEGRVWGEIVIPDGIFDDAA
jgi:hypothetical protein